MNARYYDCTTGQFISRDTYLGNAYNPWTQNLYTYTGNNPINYTDPTGHFVISVCIKLSELIHDGFSYFRVMVNSGVASESNAENVIRENKDLIISAAVDPKMVAAAIYAEHANNVDWIDSCTDSLAITGINTSVGVEQVRMSTALHLEQSGYIESSMMGWVYTDIYFPEIVNSIR